MGSVSARIEVNGTEIRCQLLQKGTVVRAIHVASQPGNEPSWEAVGYFVLYLVRLVVWRVATDSLSCSIVVCWMRLKNTRNLHQWLTLEEGWLTQ